MIKIKNLKNNLFISALKNVFSFEEIEVRISLISSFPTMFLLIKVFDMYGAFFEYQDHLLNLVGIFISSFIALLGILFTGLTIFTTLITPKIEKMLEEDKFTSKEFLLPFVEVAIIISMQIILYIFIYLTLISKLTLLSPVMFYIVIFCLVYLLFYTLFVIVALMNSCIIVHGAVLNYENSKGDNK